MNLLDAYRFHRRGRTAAQALERARGDMAAYRDAKARLEDIAAMRDMAGPDAKARLGAVYHDALAAVTKATRYGAPTLPTLSRQPDRPHLAFVDGPESFGLRYVGRVEPESAAWDTRGGTGWHTEPGGEVFNDGTGLCWGVVYQLPGRDGQARFVAGYELGGDMAGPMLDLGTVYEADSRDYWNGDARALAYDTGAAHVADSMARMAAERERDYQTAWVLGRDYADAGEEIAKARKAALALLAERRAVLAFTGPDVPAICSAIRTQVRLHCQTIADARETRRKALEGDGGNEWSVYMDSDAKAAFCEGAGLATFPG